MKVVPVTLTLIMMGCLYPQDDPAMLKSSYTQALKDYETTGSSSSLCTAGDIIGSRSSRGLGDTSKRKRLYLQHTLDAVDIDIANGQSVEFSECGGRLLSALYTKKGMIISPDREMEVCFRESEVVPASERFELCKESTDYAP